MENQKLICVNCNHEIKEDQGCLMRSYIAEHTSLMTCVSNLKEIIKELRDEIRYIKDQEKCAADRG